MLVSSSIWCVYCVALCKLMMLFCTVISGSLCNHLFEHITFPFLFVFSEIEQGY